MIDFITTSTLGDAQDFGNLSAGKQRMAPAASSTRGILAGGYTTSFENEIEFGYYYLRDFVHLLL